MRKMVLTLVLGLTACNLAIGAFAAVCESRGGARSCGAECTAQANGGCQCSGGCSKEERDWVTGGSPKVAAFEEFDY